MKSVIYLFVLLSFHGLSQSSESEILQLRQAHLEELLDTNAHVLNKEEIEHFEGLDYFDFEKSFQIEASFTKSKGKKFQMPTTTERLPWYRRYGYVDFKIDDRACRLTVYQNLKLKRNKEYKDYLFVPFRDKNSGNATYGGGRFLDVRIPSGDTLIIDFNKSYNPYCAYSYRYSCPIPPEENTLNVFINAGEKTPIGH